MSAFSDGEIEYLRGQRLGRLATIGKDGQPHVVPVGFRYNPDLDTIDVGGHGFAKSKKYRDLQGDSRVAFVVDDLASVSPWVVRGIEIRGEGQLQATGGEAIRPGFDPDVCHITARRVVSWGLARDATR